MNRDILGNNPYEPQSEEQPTQNQTEDQYEEITADDTFEMGELQPAKFKQEVPDFFADSDDESVIDAVTQTIVDRSKDIDNALTIPAWDYYSSVHKRFVELKTDIENFIDQLNNQKTDPSTEETAKLSAMAVDQEDLQQRLLHFNHHIQQLQNAVNAIASNNVGQHTDILGDKTLNMRPSKDSGELRGMSAQQYILSKNHALRKIMLYNSGFTITLRAPTPNEMHQFLSQVREEKFTFGKEFGYIVQASMDVYIKKAVCELIQKCTMGANLVDYKKNLLKAISIMDYDVILWAFITMMFPDGVSVRFPCANLDCTGSEGKSTTVDPKKLRINNWDLVPKAMAQFMADSSPKKMKQIREYQSAFNRNVTCDRWNITLGVPSLHDVLKHGEDFISGMIRAVAKEDREHASDHIRANLSSIYMDWVVSAEDEDGVVISGSDVQFLLDSYQSTSISRDFYKRVNQFIQESRVSHICFYLEKCPHCGLAVADWASSNYIAFDVQRNFFTQCSIILHR